MRLGWVDCVKRDLAGLGGVRRNGARGVWEETVDRDDTAVKRDM